MSEIDAAVNLKQIRCLGIKTTFLCNNRCGFCWQPHHGKSSDISEKALENLQPLIESGGLKVIQPAGGEVFLWKPLNSFIENVLTYNKTAQMYLVTNGTLFNDYWYSKAEKGFFSTISISLNAPDKEMYRLISGRDNFDKVESALEVLGEIKKSIDISLQVSCVLTRPLLGKLQNLVELVAGKADYLLVRELRPARANRSHDSFYNQYHIPYEKYKNAVAELRLAAEIAEDKGLVLDYSQYSSKINAKPIFSPAQCPSYEYSEDQCNHLMNQIQVEENGNVKLGCNFSSVRIGNLNESNISEIMLNPYIEELRKEVLVNGKYILCPSKLSSFGCPYLMQQLHEKKELDRVISELPEFIFPVDSQVLRSRYLQKCYRNAMAKLDSYASACDNLVSEVGSGPLSTVLMLHKAKYKYLCVGEDQLHTEMIEYIEQIKLPEVESYYTAEDYSLLLVNNSADAVEVRKAVDQLSIGAHLVVDAGSSSVPWIPDFVLELMVCGQWEMTAQFGLMVFFFRKSQIDSKSPAHIVEQYRKVLAIRSTFVEMKEKGLSGIVLFGAGRHTEWLNSIWYFFEDIAPEIRGVLDDSACMTKSYFNKKVTNPEIGIGVPFDAVVLSTDDKQELFASRCSELYGPKIKIIDLYKDLIKI